MKPYHHYILFFLLLLATGPFLLDKLQEYHSLMSRVEDIERKNSRETITLNVYDGGYCHIAVSGEKFVLSGVTVEGDHADR